MYHEEWIFSIRLIWVTYCKSLRISSCFFSSREKIRISPISLVKKCFNTVFPKEPVPPLIIKVAPLNDDIKISFYKRISYTHCINISCIFVYYTDIVFLYIYDILNLSTNSFGIRLHQPRFPTNITNLDNWIKDLHLI